MSCRLSRCRDSVLVVLSLEEDSVTSVEKIISSIPTCSVSVSANFNTSCCGGVVVNVHLLQCFLSRHFLSSACECNLEGTLRPSCDPETGECMCRIGVTGIFCDECAPGYDSAFPACEECHACTVLWAESVTDVQRAAQRMRTFIPRHSDDLEHTGGRHGEQMLEMHSKLEGLTNVTILSPLRVAMVEKLSLRIR